MKCYDHKTWKPSRNLSCRPDCGLLDDEVQPYVVQGMEVNSKKLFPWHAAILRKNADGTCVHICGATLIERNVLLTAGHCTTNEECLPYNTTTLQIVINSALSSTNLSQYSKENPEDVFEVEEIFRPWSFNLKTLKSDIAIIKLMTPVTYTETVKPICYLLKKFNRIPPFNITGTVPGFGVTERGEVSSKLKYVHMAVVPKQDCGTISDDTFCAKSNQEGGSLCYGDSGGGFVLPSGGKDEVTKYLLKGIASGHNRPKGRQCDQSSHSISSFTHLDSHSEWLLTVLQNIYSEFDD
ncbi:unnamed protein product [Allacma fusca]|uniref:Peptidase S1 domain-containing protein n=1 Tax=Allacma fusca TaxID=39272 RepID=A0A8J2JYH7_9HEXA|nr:unnamed protein product [Allacma fusca]